MNEAYVEAILRDWHDDEEIERATYEKAGKAESLRIEKVVCRSEEWVIVLDIWKYREGVTVFRDTVTLDYPFKSREDAVEQIRSAANKGGR